MAARPLDHHSLHGWRVVVPVTMKIFALCHLIEEDTYHVNMLDYNKHTITSTYNKGLEQWRMVMMAYA